MSSHRFALALGVALLVALLVSGTVAAPQTPSATSPDNQTTREGGEGVPEQDAAEALLLTTVVPSSGLPVTTKAPSESAADVVDGDGVSSSSPQPSIENSQPPDVSSSPSAPPSSSSSSPPPEDVSSTVSTGVPSASLTPPLIVQAPLMASRTIVSSGQTPATTHRGTSHLPPTAPDTPTEASVTAQEATNPASPAKEESTEVPSAEPDTVTAGAVEASTATASPVAAAAAAATTVGSPAAPSADVDSGAEDKKPADLEPESETPVFSFGIRLFTVEVVTGTERASDEQIEPTNGTQAENLTHEGVGGPPTGEHSAESTPLARNADDTADTASQQPTPASSVANTGDGTGSQQSSGATINTEVAAEVDPVPQEPNPLQQQQQQQQEDDDGHSGDAFSNEIHVERNLKNGLYRIKIAEITTDEFDNGLRENDNENMLLTDSMGGRMHLAAQPPPLHKSIYPSKINIDDFYPSKMEDFKGQEQQQQQQQEPGLDNSLQESEAEKLQREKEILRNDDSEKLFESTIMKPSDMLPILTVTELDVRALGDGMDKPSNVGTVTSASASSAISSSSPVSGATNTTSPGDGSDISTTKIEIELIDDTSETSASDERGTSSSSSSSSSQPTIDNITEKLEENDEVISRIEENFKGFRPFEGTVAGDDADDAEYRDGLAGAVMPSEGEPASKDDEVITIAISSVTFSSSQQDLTQTQTQTPGVTSTPSAGQNEEDAMMGIPVSGSDIVKNGYGGSSLFIPRRVKKNDPSTASKLAQLASSQTQAPLKKIDFAATKFNTDNTGGPVGSGHDMAGPGGKKDKPEFSTTKFYNSKELYSELHHQPVPASPLNRTGLGVGKSGTKPNAAILSEKDIISAKSAQSMGGAASRKQSKQLPSGGGGGGSELKQHTLKTNFVLNEEPEPVVLVAPKPSFNSVSSGSEQDQQRKIKSLGSAASAIIAATAKLAKPNRPSSLTTTTTTTTTTTSASTTAGGQPVATTSNGLQAVQIGEHLITRPTGAPLSRLHEKINTLDCEIQTVAPDSSVWRGNETHELELPVMTPEDCSAGSSCTPTTISWEGTADIQSGDVLIVEIDDQHLIPSNYNKSSEGAHHSTATVYQVTRLGHENCDITEGVLLDITPLVADGKKLVTLYDKDLTEGINLLIVVSEQWGQQCVRLKVTVKSDNCGENADCSGKGVCYSNNSMEGYECQCCSGFAGTHCEEIDACSPSPCTNNGICVDLSQGHEGNAYQCLCPYGYTGKNCQFESDPCNPSQCLNGGTCVGNSTHFRCDCTSGYTGPLCQHNLNECESSPCVHGICVDQEDGFRCFCQPGFSGELCNFEYNECESNPCINGGQCIDNIGGFSCKCTRGYTGKRCHIKVDFCANDPCPDGHRCIDHGDDFTCECPGGRNGPDCNQVPRTLCNVNPCANGGTCWTTEESFYCACRPGFTGKMCEENFVIDTMVSSSEMLSDTLANQNGLRAISGSTVYGEDGLVTTHGTAGGKHSSAIELHNAYIAAGTLATAILIVAIVVTACHCKVHQSYRHFATKHRQLIPVFGRRSKPANANRHWLSGKGHQQQHQHLPHQNHTNPNYNYGHQLPNSYAGMQPERIINKPLPMNLENDMYYTVDFGDSQNAPLIQ